MVISPEFIGVCWSTKEMLCFFCSRYLGYKAGNDDFTTP